MFALLTLALSLLLTAPSTALIRCAPGTYRSGTRCEHCPPGHYQWLPNQRSCKPCPANTYTPYRGVVDKMLCMPCPMDSYSSAGSSSCTKCSKFQVRSGHSGCRACKGKECAHCPPGTTSVYSHGKACEKVPHCGKGFIAPPPYTSYFPNSVCISASNGCPKGLQLFGWYRLAVCKKGRKVVCPKTHLFDGKDRCLRCYEGSIVVKDRASGRLQCAHCGGNSISPGGLARKCRPCPKGSVSIGNVCIGGKGKGKGKGKHW